METNGDPKIVEVDWGCEIERRNYHDYTVTYVDPDTGDVIATRPMTDEERDSLPLI